MTGPATIPTWGYRPDGAAQIFDLAPGEDLPNGWHPSPDVITDPEKATAEALSATAARAAETRRAPNAFASASDAGGQGRKVSHPSGGQDRIEVLQAENRRLVAEVAELQRDLTASRAAHEEALAHIQTLASQLAEALAAVAETGGEPDAGEPLDAPPPTAASAPPTRTREEARAAVRALLGEGLPAREIARRVGVSPSTVAAVKAEIEKTGA